MTTALALWTVYALPSQAVRGSIPGMDNERDFYFIQDCYCHVLFHVVTEVVLYRADLTTALCACRVLLVSSD